MGDSKPPGLRFIGFFFLVLFVSSWPLCLGSLLKTPRPTWTLEPQPGKFWWLFSFVSEQANKTTTQFPRLNPSPFAHKFSRRKTPGLVFRQRLGMGGLLCISETMAPQDGLHSCGDVICDNYSTVGAVEAFAVYTSAH